MAVARRGTQQAQTAGGSASSQSVSFPADATPGDMVAVGTGSGGTNPGASDVTDNKTNTYTKNVEGTHAETTDKGAIYSALNIAAAAGTFTVTLTNATAHDVAISEYSGVATTAALDKTANNGSASSVTSWDSGTTAATTLGDEVAIAMCVISGNPATINVANGFSKITSDTAAEAYHFADLILTVTGTQRCDWSASSGTTTYDSMIATFKGVGGGAGPQEMVVFYSKASSRYTGARVLAWRFRQQTPLGGEVQAPLTDTNFVVPNRMPNARVGPMVLRRLARQAQVFGLAAPSLVLKIPVLRTVLQALNRQNY